MARPRVFVSSTYSDLKHLRSSLEAFIRSLGYDPILSEKGDIAYTPDVALDESCYREVRNADIYVLIVGGRYGSERSDGRTNLPKQFYERYDSITKSEYKSAVGQDIPIYILVERSVYADYENFRRNRDNKSFDYAHVDSINIFYLLEEILSQSRNNPLCQFERYADIEKWLREQWAGYFRELLSQASGARQIASLAAQVAQMAEINQTLKTYLEEVVSKVAPERSEKLIRDEAERLNKAEIVAVGARLLQNPLVEFLIDVVSVNERNLVTLLFDTNSCKEFLERLSHVHPAATLGYDSAVEAEYEQAQKVVRSLPKTREWSRADLVDMITRGLATAFKATGFNSERARTQKPSKEH